MVNLNLVTKSTLHYEMGGEIVV